MIKRIMIKGYLAKNRSLKPHFKSLIMVLNETLEDKQSHCPLIKHLKKSIYTYHIFSWTTCLKMAWMGFCTFALSKLWGSMDVLLHVSFKTSLLYTAQVKSLRWSNSAVCVWTRHRFPGRRKKLPTNWCMRIVCFNVFGVQPRPISLQMVPQACHWWIAEQKQKPSDMELTANFSQDVIFGIIRKTIWTKLIGERLDLEINAEICCWISEEFLVKLD